MLWYYFIVLFNKILICTIWKNFVDRKSNKTLNHWVKISALFLFQRFCGLLQFSGNTRRKSLQSLLILLCHKYPRVSEFGRHV